MAVPLIASIIVGVGLAVLIYGGVQYASNWQANSRAPPSRSRRQSPSRRKSHCMVCSKHMDGNVKILKCNHTFHEGCITQILKHSSYCPECGDQIVVEELSRSCSVCLEPMKGSYKTSFLPCFHQYHTKCILTFFRTGSRSCPECRRKISEEDLKYMMLGHH